MGEIIVYATPTEELSERCERLWGEISTDAQQYPPHVTLTSFIDDGAVDVELLVAEMEDAVAVAPRRPPPVLAFVATNEWAGLSVSAPWLEAFARRIVSVAPTSMRTKPGLHLSLSYGDHHSGREHHWWSWFHPPPPAGWNVDLYERGGNSWSRRHRISL